jgi:hypothetical protein
MWGTCDRCQRRVTTEATIVQIQHGELVRLSDGMPRMKATGAAQFHTLCRPCGYEVASAIQQFVDPAQHAPPRSA